MSSLVGFGVALATPLVNYSYSGLVYYLATERGWQKSSVLRYMNWFASLPLAALAAVVLAVSDVSFGHVSLLTIISVVLGGSMYTVETVSKQWWTGTAIRGSSRTPFAMFPVIVVPVFEELVYRAGVAVIASWVGSTGFVVVSSILFGLHHVGLGREEIIRKTAGGAVYASLYVVTGTLTAPIAAHVGYNVIAVVVVADWSGVNE